MDNSSYIKDKEKYAQNLERYEYIVDYFENNSDRVNANRVLLTSLDKTLFNDIKERPLSMDKSIELYNRLHPLLENNLKGKLEIISDRKEERRKKRSELPLIGAFFK